MLKNIKNIYLNTTEIKLIWIITSISILLSIRVIYIQHGWINDDSVVYFEAAKLFADGNWKQGIAIYNWPLYSLLIALIHHLTHLEIQTSAQVLDVLFFAITTFSFLTLIRMVGGNKTTILCGAILLFSSSYIIGTVLWMLLRDQGFWAFFLSSLVFFIRFNRTGRLSDALCWQVFIIIAMLFRIEAITYLLLMPLVLLSDGAFKKSDRVIRFVQANVITMVVSVLLLAILFLTPSIDLASFGRLQEVLNLNQGIIIHDLMAKADLLGQMVLGDELSEYALLGLGITLAWILVIKSVEAAGWICIGLIGFTYQSTMSKPSADAKKILYLALALSLLNMTMTLLRTYVLSGRYVIALAFIILIFASFSLASLFNKEEFKDGPQGYQNKTILIFVLIVLSFSFLKNIAPKSEHHNYQQQAVYWLKAHTAPNTTVFYDSPRLRYYAGLSLTERGVRPWDVVKEAINDQSIYSYDYVVVHASRKSPEQQSYLLKILNRPIIKEFRSENGDLILIFSKPEYVSNHFN